MKKYIAEEIYPKSQTGKCMVYFNMSHHYRRIYSAKPRIDTNLTKKTPPQLCCSSPDVFNFVKRNTVKQPLLMTPRHKICAKEKDSDLFKPKILESQTESKLKSMTVYQAPQRISTKSVQTDSSNVQLVDKLECKDEQENPAGTTILKNEEISVKDNKNINIKSQVQTCQQKHAGFEENKKFSRPLDKSTVLFLKDITDDILRKGVYSNQSLNKLFTYHISKNKYFLPKDVMEKEVLRLKKELEIPVEYVKQESQETIKDEEALTALDSLFLPSDIRDKVASSLGLARNSQLPLPSPKDSFTGSLELTSLSNKVDEENENKKDYPITHDQEDKGVDIKQANDESKEDTIYDVSDNISSNKNSALSTERDSEKNTNKTNEIHNSVNLTEAISPGLEDNSYDDNNLKEGELETSSDMSSIHTE